MRKVITFLGVASLGLVLMLSGCGTKAVPASTSQQFPSVNTQSNQPSVAATPVYKRTEVITSPDAAKQLLDDGNARFASGKTLSKDLGATRRMDLEKNGQHPFAIIVSCSDSRVPPEVLYDEALGDLFVVRVAGNVITPVELGSVEYAVEHLKTPLVVVLGHEFCGAVTAAVQGGEIPGSIAAIVDKIKPAIDTAKASGATGNDLIEKTADINVQNAIQDILKSSIVKHAVDAKEVKVLGAKYDLDTGVVQWYN
ncbi:MAG: carbonic anhydrase [Desulfosporosinus sp.]|nr:carbonic anhydrase [Desulfosporosinus sp.]